MQGTPYWFLIQADPTCRGSTELETHNYSSPPPKRQCSPTTGATTERVCPPQLQSPCLLLLERNLGSKKHPALPKGVNWLNTYRKFNWIKEMHYFGKKREREREGETCNISPVRMAMLRLSISNKCCRGPGENHASSAFPEMQTGHNH